VDYKAAAWNARWKAVIQNNIDWNPSFGIDREWANNFEEWGYPLEAHEVEIVYQNTKRNGRTFDLVGFVVWLPTGHKVLGW
jgi:hypothetical protein